MRPMNLNKKAYSKSKKSRRFPKRGMNLNLVTAGIRTNLFNIKISHRKCLFF